MRVTLFSHESDVDGIFSSSIGLIRYPQARTFFLDYSKESFMKIINQIFFSNESQDKNLFIVSDLGFNDSLLSIFISTFQNCKNSNNKVIWLDHHPWSKNTIDEVTPFIELILDNSGIKCAAELIYERLSKLAQKIANGILWDIDMSEDYTRYEILRDTDKKRVLNELKLKKINDLNVVFVKSSPYIQTSLFSEEVFTVTNADIAIFYGENGKISIRRNNDKIDCNAIALNLIDGGGHKFAAGGTIQSDPNKSDNIISEIERIIHKLKGSVNN